MFSSIPVLQSPDALDASSTPLVVTRDVTKCPLEAKIILGLEPLFKLTIFLVYNRRQQPHQVPYASNTTSNPGQSSEASETAGGNLGWMGLTAKWHLALH